MELTKCTGGECPLKPTCHRYTDKDSEFQSYIEPPFKIVDGQLLCETYWGDEQQKLKSFLMSIALEKEK